MVVLSNRQRKLAKKAARAAAPHAPAMPAAEVKTAAPDSDPVSDAFLREEALAKAAVQMAAAQAEAEGRKLTGAERREIKAEFGVSRLADPDQPAALRIRSRDGLTSAKDAGVISPALHKAGLAYRLAFEAQSVGVRSGLASAGMRVDGAGAKGDPMALAVMIKLAHLRRLEKLLSPVELAVVRAVAGEGRTLRSLGTGGEAKARNRAALLSGLAAIEGGLRITAH